MCYKYSLSFKIYQLVSVSVFQIFSQNYHYKSIVSADLLNLFCCLFVASFDRVLGIKCWNGVEISLKPKRWKNCAHQITLIMTWHFKGCFFFSVEAENSDSSLGRTLAISHYWRVLRLTKIELLRCSDWRCWYIGSLCSIYSCYCHFSNLYPQPIREHVGVESWNICICDKSIFERENTVWWGMLIIYAFLDMFYKLWKKVQRPFRACKLI